MKKNAIACSFASWEAFEAHLAGWKRDMANVRVHGTTGEAPIARFEREEALRLRPLGGRPSFGSLRELKPRGRQRLRSRGRYQQLLSTVAPHRRACLRDDRCRRGSHPARDRLLHHSHVLTIRGDSYRLRAKRKRGLIKAPPGDAPSVGSAPLRSVTANHQPTP